jgi:hypothetical protein
MKQCFKCGVEKSLSEFYKHKAMKDGHLNKCKDCTKSDSNSHRKENIEKVRAYDRARGNRQAPGYIKKYREKYPNKYRAHTKVRNEIRSGNLVKEHCEVCGTEINVHAHHDDYLKPLNVRWLCSAHHSQWHAENGEALNP